MKKILVYKIAVLNTVQDFFYYLAGHNNLTVGARVWIPFRNQKKVGVVLGSDFIVENSIKLKEITSVIDNQPLLSQELLNLAIWVAEYYKAPMPLVLALFLPKKYRHGFNISLPIKDFYKLTQDYLINYQNILARAKKQRKIVEYIEKSNKPISQEELLRNDFTKSQLDSLVLKNVLVKTNLITDNLATNRSLTASLKLNNEQQYAFDIICRSLNKYHCFLLKGVTGSGKTEVYLQVIAKVLANNKQVLILVPEIGLTPQLLSRFQNRFKEHILVMHSNLNDTERQHAWQLACDNYARLIIGTRSAIFTPMPKLGLIIIDEEHDLSLKQMEGVRYFARDTALMRAYNNNIPIILGSATPSLESIYNCMRNKYTLLELKQKALNNLPLYYQIIDIRNKKLQNGFAKETIDLISKHLELNNQVLVFINRRGFAPVLLCSDCGFVVDCKNCDNHLTLHRSINKLICHHCGFIEEKTNYCKSCHGHNLLAVGIGTQRVYEYLSKIFTTTPIIRIDKDVVNHKGALTKSLDLIDTGKAQLIVGTQMLAKGHHFPKLALVVIIDTDNGFYNQDFRALERLGQLLIQVSGRAGRDKIQGQVVIQTAVPNNPFLNTLIQKGYESFTKLLLEAREKSALPPYSYLAMFRAESKDQKKLLTFLYTIKDKLQKYDLSVLGPAPAPLFKKSGKYRMQIMLKSVSRKELHLALQNLKQFLQNTKKTSSINYSIDVDPLEVA